MIGSTALWSFRGLTVNSPAATEEARRLDPLRIVAGYHTARLVLAELADAASRATFESTADPVWVSHEALLLDYEEPMVRRDPATGQRYLLSTHLPWIGERTRQPDGAHVAFLGAMANPVACKVGPEATEEEVLGLCAQLNPDRRPGRLTLISRMGAGQVGPAPRPGKGGELGRSSGDLDVRSDAREPGADGQRPQDQTGHRHRR